MQAKPTSDVAKDKYSLLRVFDKWMGSLLLFLLGHVSGKRPVPQNARSILLIKSDGIGDLVMVTASVQDIRASLPEAKIILLCGPFNYPFAKLLKGFDQIVVLNITRPWKTIRELRALHLDACVDMGEWSRLEAVVSYFSGAKWTIGFETPRQFRHFAHDMWLPHRRDQHEYQNFQTLVQPLSVKTTHIPKIELLPEVEKTIDPKQIPAPPFAIIHLWSGSAKWSRLKEWPQNRWLGLARRLNEKGLPVYLTGGKADMPRIELFLAKCQWPGAKVGSVGGASLEMLVAIVRRAAIVVSIDTSITHLAGALGTPVLSLHGPSLSMRWGPVGPNAASIDSTYPGAGYMNWGADSNPRLARLPLMEAITLDEVVKKAESMIR